KTVSPPTPHPLPHVLRPVDALRALAVQITIVKYGVGLAGRGGCCWSGGYCWALRNNIPGAVSSILKTLPGLSIKDNGRLAKAGAV
ncbi:hypothetical protein M422DRAFT_780988, partial [Sphaerobolus stellatus SS14]